MKTLDLSKTEKFFIKVTTENFVLDNQYKLPVKILFNGDDEKLKLVVECLDYYGFFYKNMDGYLKIIE